MPVSGTPFLQMQTNTHKTWYTQSSKKINQFGGLIQEEIGVSKIMVSI